MRTDRRHFLQQAWYSLCNAMRGEDHEFLPHEPALTGSSGPAAELLKFTIPAGERSAALRRLDLININALSLFGTEDSLVRTIGRRECYFTDWG